MHTTRKVIADATPARDARSSAVRRQVRLATLSPLGEIAQLVEHTTENRGVPGSSPGLAIGRSPGNQGFFRGSRRLGWCGRSLKSARVPNGVPKLFELLR